MLFSRRMQSLLVSTDTGRENFAESLETSMRTDPYLLQRRLLETGLFQLAHMFVSTSELNDVMAVCFSVTRKQPNFVGPEYGQNVTYIAHAGVRGCYLCGQSRD